MQYKTLRQQCNELLTTRRYDELQRLLSVEREKIATEMEQTLAWIPVFLPKWMIYVYAKLLSLVWIFSQNRPGLLHEEARLANLYRRLEIIIEMEQKLLAALNREAVSLMEEIRILEITAPNEK